MPRRFAHYLLPAIALAALLLTNPGVAALDTLAGQHLYTIEWEWLHQEFTFLDSVASDTLLMARSGDTWTIRTAFYRLDFPTPISDCAGLGIQAWTARLSPAETTGVCMHIFPQDANDEFSYPTSENDVWGGGMGTASTYHACPLGELSPHRSWPNSDAYVAWLLNHEWPNTTHLIIGVYTWAGGHVHLLDRVELLWDNGLDAETSPPAQPVPAAIEFLPCYPNPFNATISVPLVVASGNPVTVDVYNLLGQKVAALLNERLPTGLHEVRWSPIGGSGTYIVVVQSGEHRIASRIQYIR
jgi:hypothetical protein